MTTGTGWQLACARARRESLDTVWRLARDLAATRGWASAEWGPIWAEEWAAASANPVEPEVDEWSRLWGFAAAAGRRRGDVTLVRSRVEASVQSTLMDLAGVFRGREAGMRDLARTAARHILYAVGQAVLRY